MILIDVAVNTVERINIFLLWAETQRLISEKKVIKTLQ